MCESLKFELDYKFIFHRMKKIELGPDNLILYEVRIDLLIHTL